VQSSYPNQEQNRRLQEMPLDVGQTKSSAPGWPVPYIDLPQRLTLPFFLSAERDSEINGRQANSNGQFRGAKLISDSYVGQRRPPASASILTEELGDANSSVSLIPGNSSRPATRELISALDTAIMAAVQSRAIKLRPTDVLAHTFIEDITQRVTLTLPAVARDAEQEDQIDQRDITATAKGAGMAGLGNLMAVALRYVTNIVMAHMVSPASYGAFGEVYAVVYLLGGLANLGFGEIETHLLPAYRVKDEQGLVSGLVRFSTRITLFAGLLLGALLFAFAAMIARVFYHAPSYELILKELAPMIPLIAVIQVFVGGLQAFKEIKWKVCIELGLPFITLIALVIFYLLGWRLEALSFSALSGFACSVLIGQRVFSKIVKRFTADTTPKYRPRLWLSFSLPLLFSGLIFNIANSIDVLFLSIFVAPAQAGIYIAANRISGIVNMPLSALNIISLPLMAEYYAQGKREQLENIFKLVTKWSLSLSLPICLCCIVFHDAILGIFGQQFTTGWLVLVILCLGSLANPGSGQVLELLSITRRLRIISIDSITHLILNVGLSFVLIPRFNILGAALAGVLADVILGVLCIIQVYWIMKLHPYRWDVCKPLLAGGVASLVGILLLHFVHLQSGLGLFVALEQLGLIIPFILVYILIMMLLRFSEEDRIVFHAMLARFGRRRSTDPRRTSQ
jgi:O-antigen/teichoic acid export membrane protein